MKKFFQISGAILIIGFILLFIGKLNHGDQNIARTHTGIFNTLNWQHKTQHKDDDDDDDYDDDDEDYDDEDDDDDDDDDSSRQFHESQTYNVASFDKIKLKAGRPDIRISLGNSFQVKVSGKNIKTINTGVKSGILTVEDHDTQEKNDGNYEVAITVPNANAVKSITGTCADGNFALSNLNVASLDLRVNNGDFNLAKVKAKTADLHIGPGDLKIANSRIANSNLYLDVGDVEINSSQIKTTASLNDSDIEIKNSKLLENSTFKLNDGDFESYKMTNISYDLSTTSDSDIEVKGREQRKHYKKIYHGAPLLKIISKSGDIEIN